jgi:hypothetical protein
VSDGEGQGVVGSAARAVDKRQAAMADDFASVP